MTAIQLDLLTDLEHEQADDDETTRRRAGDFTWLRSTRAEASCTLCQQAQIWHRAVSCAIPGRSVCMAQHLISNQLRFAARQARANPRPDHQQWLNQRIAAARAAQVDVDAILAELDTHCGPLCPFRGCPTCTHQGGTDRPRKEP